MNHDDDNDIARLFAQFGGDPGTYQEIASVAAAREARSRWPLLAAIDPLAKAGALAMSADDTAAVAHAMPSAVSEADPVAQGAPPDQADEPDEATHRAQFIAPRRNTFSHDVPAAFLAPMAPAAPVAEIAAPAHEPANDGAIASAALPTGSRIEPTIDAAPTPITTSITTPTAMPTSTPMHAAALEPTSEDASSPSAADPFRRLAARPAAENESQRLPDLFKRLLSS